MVDRTLKYTSIKQGVASESFYKVEVPFDISDSKGVIQLIGYTGSDFTTIDSTKEKHGAYIAIARGSELYKTQAKYYVGYNLEEVKKGVDEVPLFNLHERSSVPSDYRVITQMEKFGPWVALVYGGGAPGEVADSIPAGSAPSYFINDTYRWVFDTRLLLEVKITKTIGGVSDPETTYRIKPINDISETYGVFQFELFSGIDLGYDSLYFAIKTGSGSEGDRGYIATGGTEANAIANLDKINSPTRTLHNYNAESTAPVIPNVIRKIDSRRYMEFSRDTSGAYNGGITPYQTKIYKFDLSTLVMEVETYVPTQNQPSTETYSIKMRLDEGDFAGVVELQGPGLPLNRQFLRIDVQQGANEGDKIRILIDSTLDNLKPGKVTPIVNTGNFSVTESSHGDELKNQLAMPLWTRMFPASFTDIANIGVGFVDSVDGMYDFKHTSLIKINFSVTPATVTIIDFVDGVEVENATYTALAMHDQNLGTPSSPAALSIIKLAGSGTRRDQFVGFLQSSLGTADFVYVHFGNTYVDVQSISTASPKYVRPTYPWSTGLTEAHDLLGALAGKGYGTPSFVSLKNSSYNPNDTETWTFNTTATNLRVVHKSGIIDYNLYMDEVIDKVDVSGEIIIKTLVFYLRSKDANAPYNRKYVALTNAKFSGKPAPGTEATFRASIGNTKAEALAKPVADQLEFRDIKSASVPARVIDLAAGTEWILVLPHSADQKTHFYQLNKNNYEIWRFKVGGSNVIEVENQAGTKHTYTYIPRTDESSHRGTFTIESTDVNAPYNNNILAIGIGGEPPTSGVTPPLYNPGTAYDANFMRLGAARFTAGNVGAAEAQAIKIRNELSEWSLRKIEDARLHFHLLMKAIEFDDRSTDWVRLEKDASGNYVYNAANTKRWRFVNLVTAGIENVNGSSPIDFLASDSAAQPVEANRYGIQLISSSPTGFEANFKIFRKDDSGKPVGDRLSNKFVVLSLGQGLNQKSMRIGIGNTLQEAQTEFNALGLSYNWATFDKATAGTSKQVIESMQEQGIWSLTRNGGTSETGSATTTSGTGHLVVALDGITRPIYDPNNTIDFTLDKTAGVIAIKNILSSSDLNNPGQTYGLIPTEGGPTGRESVEGVYVLSGFGPYNNNFAYFEMAEAADTADRNKGQRGRLSISTSLNTVKQMNQQLKTAGTYNFFATEWIKVSGEVFEHATRIQANNITAPNEQGALVHLGMDDPANDPIYNTKLTRSFTILPNVVGYNKKSIIISNASPTSTRDDLYIYEMVESTRIGDGKDYKAIAVLKGTGPDRGKYVGIRVPTTSTGSMTAEQRETYAGIVIANTIAELKTALQWTTDIVAVATGRNTLYTHRGLDSVRSKTEVMRNLQSAGSLVLLDQDLVYLHENTTEWTFDANALQATVVQRVPDASPVIHTYSTILHKTSIESSMQGVVLLKALSAGAPLDKYVLGISVNTGAQQNKFYIFNTATDFQGAITQAINATTNTTLDRNLVDLNLVYYPQTFEIFNTLARIGNLAHRGKWSGLQSTGTNTYAFGTAAQTTNFTFNNTRHDLTISIGSTTYNARYRISTNEFVAGSANLKATFQIMPKTGASSTLPDALKYSFVGIELHKEDLPDGFKYALASGTKTDLTIPSSVATTLHPARSDHKDYNFLPSEIFNIDKTPFNTWNTALPHFWRPIDANDNWDGVNTTIITYWEAAYNDPNTRNKAVWTYDMNPQGDNRNFGLGLQRTTALVQDVDGHTSHKNMMESRARLVKFSGTHAGVVRTYDYGRRFVSTSVVPSNSYYSEAIYNKYHAFEVGQGVFHLKMKMTTGDTIEQAEINRNTLSFYNLRGTHSTICHSYDAITNANKQHPGNIQQGANWAQWVDTTSGTPTSANNMKYWSFDHESTKKSATYTEVVNGVSRSSTYQLIVISSDLQGNAIFGLYGFGPFDRRIATFHRGPDASNLNTAKIYVAPTNNNIYTHVTNHMPTMSYSHRERRDIGI
ncbi:MAG: hypothetical protein ACRCTJ_00060 [Brevinema sp.]